MRLFRVCIRRRVLQLLVGGMEGREAKQKEPVQHIIMHLRVCSKIPKYG